MRSRMHTFICLALLTVSACSSDRIHRAAFTTWTTVERPSEGVEIEMPADAHDFQMHYRSNGIADATWFISIAIERKTATDFANPLLPKPGDRGHSDASYMKWLAWLTSFHPEVSEYDMGDQSKQYRRDVRLPNGDVASIRATYRYGPFTEPERAVDEAAIRRILNSARPLSR